AELPDCSPRSKVRPSGRSRHSPTRTACRAGFRSVRAPPGRCPSTFLSRPYPFLSGTITAKRVVLPGNGRAFFKFFAAIHQRGSCMPCGAVMPKWGLARDVTCHPTKRVKVTARRNDIKNELICYLPGGKE